MMSPMPAPVVSPVAPPTASGSSRSPASATGATPSGTNGFAQALDEAQAPPAESTQQPGPAHKRLQAGKDAAKAGPREAKPPGTGDTGTPATERDPQRQTLPPELDAAEPEGPQPLGLQGLLAQLQITDPARATALSGARLGPDGTAGSADKATAALAADAELGATAAGLQGESGRLGAQRNWRAGVAQGLAALQGAQAALANQAAGAVEDSAGRKGAAAVAAAGSERAAAAFDTAVASAASLAGVWAATATAPNATGGAAAPAQAHLDAAPGSPTFAQQLGAQLTTFVLDGVQHARLHLNPAEMGPVSVQIQLDGQTAVVHLGAEQAQTRQALEQALPQLASQLSEAGLTLTGGGVFEHAQQGRQGTGTDRDGGGSAGRSSEPWAAGKRQQTEDMVLAPTQALQRRGVVDLVA